MAVPIEPLTAELELTNANQFYPYVVPAGVRSFDFQARQARDIQIVAGLNNTQYFTLKSGNTYYVDERKITKGFTLHFRDPSNAGTVVEFLLWRDD
jgi:hypothetical protein